MWFFNRGKDDDWEEEEGKPKKSARGRSSSGRKEPPKPWGKRERYGVGLVLLATVIASFLLALSARSWKLPGLPRIAIPELSFEKTFILKGEKTSKEDFSEAINAFREKTRDLSGVYGFYVVRLKDGVSYGYLEKESFQAASLIKLPTLAALFLEAEKEEIDLDSKYTLKSSDKISGSGSLQNKPAGTRLSYRKLARLMGQESDNTAFNIVRQKVGDEKIDSIISDIGMNNTLLEENLTTPRDIGIFFKKLWRGDIVTEESRDEIIKYLTDTVYESWLPEGISYGVEVAHKFGREVHVVNDAGIVFADDPFVLVIMTKGVVEREADEVFPNLAKLIYEFETN